MEKEFCLEEYISRSAARINGEPLSDEDQFLDVLKIVELEFEKEWNNTDEDSKARRLEREKRAMMGYNVETQFFKERIKEIIQDLNLSACWHPPWYPNLYEGVFAELYGLAGLAPWAYDMKPKYKNSTSAKLIGDKLYCMIDGKAELQPQRISKRRREQLKRTLLLATPHERLEFGFHEVFLRNGIRITIYSGNRTKKDQEVFVLRKYVLNNLTLEELAKRETIPEYSIPFFKQMISVGFNVLFSGPVRSGKTTFMQVWQTLEDRSLEGLAIATDVETMWNEIIPDAPIMQLVADGEELRRLTKSLMRGDNDYILLEEMRDAAAFSLALDITSTGTRRSKATVHESSAVNVPYKMASKIVQEYGGSLRETIAQVFKSFDYCIELCVAPYDPGRKMLKSIWQYDYDEEKDQCSCRQICYFDFDDMLWRWDKSGVKKKVGKYPELFWPVQQFADAVDDMMEISGGYGSEVIPGYYKGQEW